MTTHTAFDTSRRIRHALAWLGGSITTAILMMTLSSQANLKTDGVSRFIPYRGALSFNGTPVNLSVEMEFKLYNSATDDTPEWAEQHTVTCYNGVFSVLLGNGVGDGLAALTDVLRNADDVHIGITLMTSEGTVEFGQKKRFVQLPYSYWATQGTDFTVGQKLRINTNKTLSSSSNAPLVVQNGTHTMGFGGQRIESNTLLHLNYRSQNTTHTPEIRIGGSLDFKSINGTKNGGTILKYDSGNIVINEDGELGDSTVFASQVTFGENVSGISGQIEVTNVCDQGQDFSGSSNQSASCSDEDAMTSLRLTGASGNVGAIFTNFKCCDFAVTID